MFIRILKNRLIGPIKVLFKDIVHGLVSIGILRFFSSMLFGTKVGYYIINKMHNSIIHRLENNYSAVIDKYKDYKYECFYDDDAPVWISWLQGFEEAPLLVKKCIESIKESTNHPIYLVTRDNLENHVDIPDFVMAKYDKGIITNAQFSDILRMSLLSKYGGLWIDATIFIPKELPEDIFKYEFYTCKREPRITNYVSNYRWTSFLNGCQKGCIVQKVMNELFLEYWKDNEYLIDYLLVDYFMAVVYNNLPSAKKLIDEVPYNNLLVEELQNRMSMPFNQKDYDDLLYHSDTYLFKLSWRMNFEEKSSEGIKTYYKEFIDSYQATDK